MDSLKTVISDGMRLMLVCSLPTKTPTVDKKDSNASLDGNTPQDESARSEGSVPQEENDTRNETEGAHAGADHDNEVEEVDFFDVAMSAAAGGQQDPSLRVETYEFASGPSGVALSWLSNITLSPWASDVPLNQAFSAGSEFYTNGYKLAIVLASLDPESKGAHFKLFNLQNGLQENDLELPEALASSKSFCFDACNNVTWSLTHDFGLVTTFPNLGSAVPAPPRYYDHGERRAVDLSYCCSSITSRPEYAGFRQNISGLAHSPPPLLNQEQVVLFVLAHIDRLLSQNANSLSDLEFAVEITLRAFSSLLWLFDTAAGRTPAGTLALSDHGRRYLLLAVLRILRQNLSQVMAYSSLPKFLVMGGPSSSSSTEPHLVERLRDLALLLFFTPEAVLPPSSESSSGKADTFPKLLKEEAAELLGVGALLFFPDKETRTALVTRLFEPDFRGEAPHPLADPHTSDSFLFFDALRRGQPEPLASTSTTSPPSSSSPLDLCSFLGGPTSPLVTQYQAHLAKIEGDLLRVYQETGRLDPDRGRRHANDQVIFGEYLRSLFRHYLVELVDQPAAPAMLPDLLTFVQTFLRSGLATLTEVRKAAKKLERAAADTFLREFGEVSLVGRCLPFVVSTLFLFASNLEPLSRVAPDLVSLLQAVSRITPYSDQVHQAEERYLTLNRQFGGTQDSRVVGTRHPYRGSSTQEKEVMIANARYLLLRFDARSAFANYSDHLSLFADADKSTAIGEVVYIACPRELLFVPGDTVVFVFEHKSSLFDSRDLGWGYECQVDGFVPEHCLNLPWLLDLEKSLACLVGLAIQTMTRQPKILLDNTQQETECLDWLQSPLLRNVHESGRTLGLSTSEALLHALCEDRTSKAHRFHLLMKAKVSRGRPTLLSRLQLGAAEAEAIEDTFAHFVAALLRHCAQPQVLRAAIDRATLPPMAPEGGIPTTDADLEDAEQEDQIGELSGYRDSASGKTAPVLLRSHWKFALKILDWLGERRQDLKNTAEGNEDDEDASAKFLAFLAQVRARIRFVAELSPLNVDLAQPTTPTSPVASTSSTSQAISRSRRSSSFDASSLSPSLSRHPAGTTQGSDTAVPSVATAPSASSTSSTPASSSGLSGMRRSTSSYNQARTAGKKKSSPSLGLAQLILQFVESQVDPDQLGKIVQETTSCGKLRSTGYAMFNRLLHTGLEASAHQDLVVLFAAANLATCFAFPPAAMATTDTIMVATPHHHSSSAARLPTPFFPTPFSSALLSATTPEAILLHAKKEQAGPAAASSTAVPMEAMSGLQRSGSASSSSDLFAAASAPIVPHSPAPPLELEYSYARGLLACPENLLKELRSRYLDIIRWSLDTLANQEADALTRLAAVDLLVSRLHPNDFAVINQVDGVKTLFTTLDWAEEVLLSKGTIREREAHRWVMRLHKKVFDAIKYLYLYSTKEQGLLTPNRGLPEHDRDFEVLLTFQKSLFTYLLRSLEIQARRFIKKSKKLSDGYWDTLPKTMEAFGSKATPAATANPAPTSTADSGSQTPQREAPPIIDGDRDVPIPRTPLPDEISSEAYSLLFADSFCYERISLFLTVFAEIHPQARSITDSSFLSMMLIRLLTSGHASPRVSMLLPRLLRNLMPHENPDTLFELLKGHGVNSRMFNFTLRVVDLLKGQVSPFLQMAFTMLTHLTRPAQGELEAPRPPPAQAVTSTSATLDTASPDPSGTLEPVRPGSPDSSSEAVTSVQNTPVEPEAPHHPRPLEISRLREQNRSTESVTSIESTGLGRLLTLWSIAHPRRHSRAHHPRRQRRDSRRAGSDDDEGSEEQDDKEFDYGNESEGDEEDGAGDEQVGFLTWSSHERFTLASEIIDFIRSLMSSASWRENMIRGLQTTLASLSQVSDLVKSGADPEIPSLLLANAEAALMIVGGFLEPIRTGGQVVVLSTPEGNPLPTSSQTKGTVVFYDGCDTLATVFANDCQSRLKISQLAAVSPREAEEDWIELTPATTQGLQDVLQPSSPLWKHFGPPIMAEVRLCLLRALVVILRRPRNVQRFLEGDGFGLVSLIAISEAVTVSEKCQPHEFLHLYTRARETPTQQALSAAGAGPSLAAASDSATAPALSDVSPAAIAQRLPYSPVASYLLALPGPAVPAIRTLPTKMVTSHTADLLEVLDGGLTVVYHGPAVNNKDVGVATSNEPFTSLLPLIYYEVKVQNGGTNTAIGVGLIERGSAPRGMPGWYDGSYGYHGDDGNKFTAKYYGRGRNYSGTYAEGDVIGCGLLSNKIFYTKNGKYLGVAFKGVAQVPTDLYVMVGLHTDREPQVRVNFGQAPFVFDVANFVIRSRAPKGPSKPRREDPTSSDEEEMHRSGSELSAPALRESDDNDDDDGDEDDGVQASLRKELALLREELVGGPSRPAVRASMAAGGAARRRRSTRRPTSGRGARAPPATKLVAEEESHAHNEAPSSSEDEGSGEEQEEEKDTPEGEGKESSESEENEEGVSGDPQGRAGAHGGKSRFEDYLEGRLAKLEEAAKTEGQEEDEDDSDNESWHTVEEEVPQEGESSSAEGQLPKEEEEETSDSKFKATETWPPQELSALSEDDDKLDSEYEDDEGESEDDENLTEDELEDEFGGEDEDEGTESSVDEDDDDDRRRRRRAGRLPVEITQVRVGDLLRVNDPVDIPSLSLAMECYGLDAEQGLLGCIGRVLAIKLSSQRLLMGFHVTPQGLWFSLWLTVFQLESLLQEDPTAEVLSHPHLTTTLTYLTAQNVALQILSRISHDPAGLAATLHAGDVRAHSTTFLRFLKITVGSLLPLAPRSDDLGRETADAWTGELETRLFRSPVNAEAHRHRHSLDPQTAAKEPASSQPHTLKRRASVTWLEGTSKTFVSQHLFAELDLKMETLSSKDYTIRALSICRSALIKVIEQDCQASGQGVGQFSTMFLESLREAFSDDPDQDRLDVHKGQSTQPLPPGAFTEVIKVDAAGLKSPLVITFVNRLCGIDFDVDRVAIYETETLDGEPLKVFGKEGTHSWHSFLIPTNRFWIQIVKASEDSQRGVKFMALPLTSAETGPGSSVAAALKQKFAYGWWALQAATTGEVDQMIKEGHGLQLYGADLYDRLSGFVLSMPNLFPLKGEAYHLLSRYLSAADAFYLSQSESTGAATVFNLAKYSKLWEKLKTTRNELYDDYPEGHALLQALTEVFLTLRKLIEGKFQSEKDRERVRDLSYLFGISGSPKKRSSGRDALDNESALEWMDGLYLAIDFLNNVDRFRPLSSLLVDKAILHTVPPTSTVESGHPYSIADDVQKVEIHSEDTQSLQVVFDQRSNTHRFDILTIRSAGKLKEEDESSQFYGGFGDRRVNFQSGDISYTFKMAHPSEYVHGGVECDGCHTSPLKGPRFKCMNCLDFDICQECEASEHHYHDPKHVFFKAVRPLPPADDRPSALIPFISDQDTTEKTEPWECSHCHDTPIVGAKWICANCEKLTVVCNNCEKVVTQTHFGGLHLWLKFRKNPSIDFETRTLRKKQRRRLA